MIEVQSQQPFKGITTKSDVSASHTVHQTSLLFVTCVLVLFGGLGQSDSAAAQSKQLITKPPGPIHYTWHEYRIPMRDGILLYTSAFSPDDERTDYPILLERTPYGAQPSSTQKRLQPEFAQSGYIFVFQDVRGRYQSQGSFTQNTPQRDVHQLPTEVDESTDTYDTIDWLIKHVPHNNGRVGMRGISYPGFFAAAGMIDAHPALKAVSPQAAEADWFIGDDTHHHGAFLLDSSFGWMSQCMQRKAQATVCAKSTVDFGTLDDYEFFLNLEPLRKIDASILHGAVTAWTEEMQHGNYDAYWKARNLLPHIRNIHPAVLMVGGWYDANDFYGTLHIFQTLHTQSPTTTASLVVGPWYHGQWRRDNGAAIEQLSFGAQTSEFFLHTIELPFFERYLKDAKDPGLPQAYMFATGLNQWRQFDAWPPKGSEPRSIYLRENGRLAFEPAANKSGRAYDEYVSDPKRPVPYTSVPTIDMDPQYMARDQRFVRRRPDILVYESDPLSADLTIAGPIVPRLFVSTTGTDSDWIVRLIDVYPERPPSYVASSSQMISTAGDLQMAGFQQLVRGDVIRSKFRNSLEKPQPMQPGRVTAIEFTMDDVLHTFKKGHRVMVQIQSTWFPLVDLNPQKFVNIYEAAETDFQPATQRIYHTPSQASQLIVRVLPSLE